eukprot:TRINITY_DN121_c1_g1_i7.p1 TRINITY_DN121_c1_g1~~TRINITY_DN121_c1_g1_i7.p1  ORF type:complete len:453 (+),score=66.51 TRINITY_DN121_c1_g1_i7:53-1411(+)
MVATDGYSRVQVDDDAHCSSGDESVVSSSASMLTKGTKRNEMLKCYANIVCTMAGTGILQLPQTLEQGGWMMAPTLVVIAIMANYTGDLVIDNLYRPTGRLAGYPETGDYCFGQAGKFVVHLFQKGTVLGVSTLFLILAAGFLHDTYQQADAAHHPTKKTWTLISVALVAPPTLLLKNVDALSFTSALGGFVTVAGVFSIILLAIFHQPDESPSHKVINVMDFPIAFSTVVLSYGGHACFPTIQHNMAELGVGRTRFKKVLKWSFLTLLAFYLPVAITGYQVYGHDVQSPIVNSLPESNPGTVTIKLAMTLNTLLTFPILQHVIFHELEEFFNMIPEDGSYITSMNPSIIVPRFLLRLFFLTTSAVIAYFVPYFDSFMSLVGALCVTMMVFVLPCVFAIKISEMELEGERTNKLLMWYGLLILIIVVGVVGGSIGSWQAIKNLIDDVKNHKE